MKVVNSFELDFLQGDSGLKRTSFMKCLKYKITTTFAKSYYMVKIVKIALASLWKKGSSSGFLKNKKRFVFLRRKTFGSAVRFLPKKWRF